MKNADQPAHPVRLTYSETVNLTNDEINEAARICRSGDSFSTVKTVTRTEDFGGLTKRELIAAMAMKGALGNSFWAEQYNQHANAGHTKTPIQKDIAEMAVRMADELLKQLES